MQMSYEYVTSLRVLISSSLQTTNVCNIITTKLAKLTAPQSAQFQSTNILFTLFTYNIYSIVNAKISKLNKLFVNFITVI